MHRQRKSFTLLLCRPVDGLSTSWGTHDKWIKTIISYLISYVESTVESLRSYACLSLESFRCASAQISSLSALSTPSASKDFSFPPRQRLERKGLEHPVWPQTPAVSRPWFPVPLVFFRSWPKVPERTISIEKVPNGALDSDASLPSDVCSLKLCHSSTTMAFGFHTRQLALHLSQQDFQLVCGLAKLLPKWNQMACDILWRPFGKHQEWPETQEQIVEVGHHGRVIAQGKCS